MQVQDRAAAAQDFAEGSGEVDPLDAYMAENNATIAEDEEVDPLDAFMADLAPKVRQDMAAAPPAQPAAAPTSAQGRVVEDASDVKPPTSEVRATVKTPGLLRPALHYMKGDRSWAEATEH